MGGEGLSRMDARALLKGIGHRADAQERVPTATQVNPAMVKMHQLECPFRA